MAPSEFLETFRVIELAILYAILLCLAVLSTAWIRLTLAGLARLLRFLHGRGLIRIGSDGSSPASPSMPRFDRTFVSISRLLERACHRIPGDPNRHTHPFVLALLLVGVPILLGVALLTFVVPFLLFSYVTGTTSVGPGLLAVVGYVVALVGLTRGLRAVPDAYGRLRRTLRRRTALV